MQDLYHEQYYSLGFFILVKYLRAPKLFPTIYGKKPNPTLIARPPHEGVCSGFVAYGLRLRVQQILLCV